MNNILIASIDTATGHIHYARVPQDCIRVAICVDVTDEQLAALNAAPDGAPLEPIDEQGIVSCNLGKLSSRKRAALIVNTVVNHGRAVLGDKHIVGDDEEWTLEECAREMLDGF